MKGKTKSCLMRDQGPNRHCNKVAQLLLTCIQGREPCPEAFVHTPSFYKPRLHFEKIMSLGRIKFQRFQLTRGEGQSYSESPNSDDNHTNINGTVLYKHLCKKTSPCITMKTTWIAKNLPCLKNCSNINILEGLLAICRTIMVFSITWNIPFFKKKKELAKF